MKNSASRDNKKKQLHGKSYFPDDFAACETYLWERNLVPVCDFSIQAIIINRILPQNNENDSPKLINVMSRIACRDAQSIANLVKRDRSYVWISCGSTLGLPLRDALARHSLVDGQVVGVAGASVFNCGYTGITLYEWNAAHMQRHGMPGRTLARFYGGEQPLVTASTEIYRKEL